MVKLSVGLLKRRKEMRLQEFVKTVTKEDIDKNRLETIEMVRSYNIENLICGDVSSLQDRVNKGVENFKKDKRLPDNILITIKSNTDGAGWDEPYEIYLQAGLSIPESDEEVIKRLWKEHNKQENKEKEIKRLEKRLAKLKKEN
jgi:hypothetical protein